MSARQNIYVSRSTPVDGGTSPNTYVAAITAEIRVFFPPLQRDAARVAFEDAVIEARSKFEDAS